MIHSDDETMLTDLQLCEQLGISRSKLQTHMREGPPRHRKRDSKDIRMIDFITIGGSRRWSRPSVRAFKKSCEDQEAAKSKKGKRSNVIQS